MATAALAKPATDDTVELGKLLMTTLLAASSAVLSASPPPTPEVARLLAQPSSTTMVMRETPRHDTPMGRAVEVALRTGVLTVPSAAALQMSAPTAAPTTAPTTAPTLAAPTDVGVTTSAILPADKVWMVNLTALASSSPLSQQLFGDLPAVDQALAHALLATAAETNDPVVTWQLFNAIKQAVTSDASASERQALIHNALVKSASLQTVLEVAGLVEHLTPRQQQVFRALVDLGDQHVYASGLVDSIVATVLKPGFASSLPTEQQAAVSAVFAERSAYVGVYAADVHHGRAGRHQPHDRRGVFSSTGPCVSGERCASASVGVCANGDLRDAARSADDSAHHATDGVSGSSCH